MFPRSISRSRLPVHPRATIRGPVPRIACLLALVAACSSEPTSPGPRTTGPTDVAEHAFLLTIDVATGRVSVREPARSAGGPSFSLLGGDAVALHVGNCTFSSIPNNSKLKSCSMPLSIENQLSSADLVAPTAFPKPPAGAGGILVFPYTAAGLGVPGGAAVPNAFWDGAPANFFNDFSGCTTGKTSDCYRWETYASPLNAGATSATRTVGFDVDKNANTVATYIVVAADLRDNPIQTLGILPEPGNCGYRSLGDAEIHIDPDTLRVGNLLNTRSLCSFDLRGVPADVVILTADLRVFQTKSFGDVRTFGPVLVDHMDYGTLDNFDFTNPALTSNIGNFAVETHATFQTLSVLSEVNADLTASRVRSQYRLRLAETFGDGVGVNFAGPSSGVPPLLTITYRKQ